LSGVPSLLDAAAASRGCLGRRLPRTEVLGQQRRAAEPGTGAAFFYQSLPASILINLLWIVGGFGVSQPASTRPSAVLGGGSIGRPIANTQIYILDTPVASPCQRGNRGNCVLAARPRPRLLMHRRRPNVSLFPILLARPGEKIYRTGDRAPLSAGWQHRISRVALIHQVKIRGFRVEPGEVEVSVGAASAGENKLWSSPEKTATASV